MHSATRSGSNSFHVRQVPLTRPFIWLALGWQDFRDHPMASMAYGALVCIMGMVILMFNRHPYMIAASLSGFLLFGPIMTAGLCELSRRRDNGQPRDFDSSLQALRHNSEGLLGFARRLLLISVIWFVLSSLLLHFSLGNVAPALIDTIWGDVLSQLSSTQLIAYFGLGAVLSAIVFAISVVSVPMILDLNADANTAIATSLQVCWRDLPAMLLWALLIVMLVAVGFATLLLGLVVVFPLLGHATWYAYRDLVH